MTSYIEYQLPCPHCDKHLRLTLHHPELRPMTMQMFSAGGGGGGGFSGASGSGGPGEGFTILAEGGGGVGGGGGGGGGTSFPKNIRYPLTIPKNVRWWHFWRK